MPILYKKISEDEFNKSAYPILFNDPLTSFNFGVIEQNGKGFKFSWQSSIVKLYYEELENSVVIIGIDCNFCIADLLNGYKLLGVNLDFNFMTAYFEDHYILTATELEIIKIGREKWNIISEQGLPDIFEKFERRGEELYVVCMDGSVQLVTC